MGRHNWRTLPSGRRRDREVRTHPVPGNWLDSWLGVCFEKSLHGLLIHVSEPQTGSSI